MQEGMCQNSVIFLCVSAFFWALWIDCSWAFSCCSSLRDAESFSCTWLITAASLDKKWEKEREKNTLSEKKTRQAEANDQHKEWHLCLPSISPVQSVSKPLDFSLHLAHPLSGLKELNIKWALGALCSLIYLHTIDGAGRSRSRPSGISKLRVQKVKYVRSGRGGSPLSLHFPFAWSRIVFGGCSLSLLLCKLSTLVQRAAFWKHHGLHGLHTAWKRFPQTCTNACKPGC